MAAPVVATRKRALAMESWGFVPAIADLAAPTVAELTAVGGFNLSCSVLGDQEGVTGSTEKLSLPRLLCEDKEFDILGSTKVSLGDLRVVWDPQSATGSDGRKAWETLTDNITGFLWRRQNIPAKDDIAAGQKVDIFPVQLGVKIPDKTGTDNTAIFAFTQAVGITGDPEFQAAVAA